MEKLFDLDTKEPNKNDNTCKQCEHRQSWECNSKVFQYCGARKSNRTKNGLLKIKCKDTACIMFKIKKNE